MTFEKINLLKGRILSCAGVDVRAFKWQGHGGCTELQRCSGEETKRARA